MIISKKNIFVFVRVPKTGSTSAQATIINSGIIGPDDIYSGYRKFAEDVPRPGVNVPASINTKKIMEISPYDVSKELHILKKIPTFEDDGKNGLIGHLTPTEMVRLGLVTEKELSEYTVIGTLREPIDRVLSIWFLYSNLEKRAKTKHAFIGRLKSGHLYPTTFLGKSQKNFFEYEGQMLKNIKIIDFNDLNQELKNLTNHYDGEPTGTYSFESYLRPDWAKVPYQEWLPRSVINYLRQQLQDDIEFYNLQISKK